MAWRDQLQPGSFRGVAFKIDSANTQIGRRVQLHQYPLRDRPYPEDLGRRARRFSVDCLVIGPNYLAERDALIRALEQSGPGTLVHPFYGTRRVVVVDAVRVFESTSKGGMARFQIPFAESGENIEPAVTADTQSQVKTKATDAGTALAADFANNFSVSGQPQWVSNSATSDLQKINTRLAALRGSVPSIPTAVTTFNGQLQSLSDNSGSLIRTPANLGASVVSLVVGLQTIAQQPMDALKLYHALADFGASDKPIAPTTPARTQQLANRTALHSLVRGVAAVQAAHAAANVPAQTSAATTGFDTASNAQALREQITSALDDQALTASDSVYTALMDVRTATVRDINARAAALPQLITFTPAKTLPALVIAWRLYADASRSAEIVARNDLSYPGFATGGQPLEVVSE